ncbi:hypothetical protein COCMIDRAFT_22927 [Bipolaris oryzae ATCC 44560]|uniref:UBZ4-type domain-containing protein n=1 Tax=Bipolaris oryzae ATCC 44560 TaxID=930090 RepID=W7A030_COCMI|nr:uncharacterized protein COCMIDRAFT_22927 [Bipolaris oryzae ATCC 44560]EUC49346.1 hypothetical protein COCMIDRAFT_22927 [Bipolaris oryzae ATCC 44560]
MQTGRRGHPNRQPRGDSSERGNRGRGRGRGRGPPNNSRGTRGARPSQAYTPVPPYASIHPGTPVSLILKQDQPTGHRVSGIVADILTRGDHPRGVKVRLRDGRVGRVQSLVSEAEGGRGEALVGGADAGLGRDGEVVRGGGRMVGGRMERDVRENDEYFYDEGRRGEVDGGYFAALEEADRRYAGSRGGGETAVCPVCGVFEGDEVAVARHVESHFGE